MAPQQQPSDPTDLSEFGPPAGDAAPSGDPTDLSEFGPSAEPVGNLADPVTGRQQAIQAAQNLAIGAEKGGRATIGTIGRLLGKIPPGYAETGLPQKMAEFGAPEKTKPEGLAQTAGYGAEGITEFLALDAGAKAASLGDQLMNVGRIADMYEKASPFAKAAMNHLMNMVRWSGAGAVAGGLKGGERGAIEGAVTAPLLGTAGTLASQAVRGFPVVEKLISPIKEPPATMDPSQPVLQQHVTNMANQIALNAGVKPLPGTLDTTFERLSDAIEAKAHEVVEPIDEFSQKEFFNKRRAIKQLDREIKASTGTETTEADVTAQNERLASKQRLERELGELVQGFKDKGGDPAIADQFERLWRHQSAIDDLDAHHKASMPGHTQAVEPTMNANTWSDRIYKMLRTEGPSGESRLAEAMNEDPKVGKQIAAQMKAHADEAVRTQEATKGLQAAREEEVGRLKTERAERVKAGRGTLKRAVGTAAGGAALGGAAEAYRALKGPE